MMDTPAPKERIAVYIDGGNFYRHLKAAGIGKSTYLDYTAFSDFVARGRTLVSKRYYIGSVRNHDNSAKSQKMVEDQQKFLGKLEKEGFSIKRGRIVYDHQIREKGVDVKITVDLIVGAIDNLYDTALIVSSDTLIESAQSEAQAPTSLVIAQGNQIEVHSKWTHEGVEHVPVPATHNLIKHRAIKLPGLPMEYGSTEKLAGKIER
jgi:uncharacterized LabA/DUF88 family protein